MKNLTDEFKESGEWKTQLSVKIVFTTSKDIDENPDIYSWSDNKELMMSEETSKFIEELFTPFFL